MSIGNLLLGVNSIMVSYFIRYDSFYIVIFYILYYYILFYYKMRQVFLLKKPKFYYKMQQLLQIATVQC